AFSALADAKLICPFIDARRQAIYTGLYESKNNCLLTKMPDSHIQVDDWLERLNDLNEKIHFISPYLEIYQSTITEKLNENAIFHNIKKEAFIAESLLNLYEQHEKSNVHSVVPNYIRKTEA